MKSGRVFPLLVCLFAFLTGLGVFAYFQMRSERKDALAMEEEKRTAAVPAPGAEVVEAPAADTERAATVDPAAEDLRTAAVTERLEIQVIDAASAPVIDALLVLFRDETVLAKEATDAQGLVRMAAPGGTGSFVLRVAGSEALRGELDLAPGRRTLTLAESTIVSGTATLDGGSLPEPLQLNWRFNQRKGDGPGLPTAVVKAMNTDPRQGMRVSTKADGSFEFRGLPPDASGTIQWDAPYMLEATRNEFEGRRVQIPVPRRDVLLRLVSVLQIRLRVVDSEGVPIPKASVNLRRTTVTESGTSSSSSGLNADAEGRAIRVIPPETFDKLIVTVSGADASGPKIYEFTPPGVLHGPWDLGDLATQATRQISVLVQNSKGEPIAGAQAMSWPAPTNRSNVRTDAAGRMTLRLGADDKEVAVEAFEYLTAVFPCPAGPAGNDELVATLAPACTLEFEVADLVGKEHELTIELKGPMPMFVGENSDGPQTLRAVGSGWSASSGDDSSTIEVSPEKNGRWRIAGLISNQALHGALKGSGKTLREFEIAPLYEGERRKIELVLNEVGKSFRVRVVNPDGKPIAGATLFDASEGGGGNYQSHRTDANGEALLVAQFGDRCRLLARAEGFAPRTLTLRPIPTGTVDIALELPRSVEVELVGRNGAPFDGKAQVRVNSMGFATTRGISVGRGRYRLDGLPRGEVVIEVSASPNASMSQLHDTAVPMVRLVVGEAGSITATVHLDGAPTDTSWRIAVVPAGSLRSLTVDRLHIDENEGNAWFNGLAPGAYDIWLEKLSDDVQEIWQRVGAASPALIDAEHLSVKLDMRIPG